MRINTPFPILYVEDEISYAEHLAYLFRRQKVPNRLIHLSHGEDAIAYLSRKGKFTDPETSPLPGLMLVDLKMPRVNGFELLQFIRTKSKVPWMPVVVMTVSEDLKDVQKAYQLGAQSFLVKPINTESLAELLETWENYWLKNVSRFMQ